MGKYILKRLLQSIVTVFLVILTVFMLLRLMPTSGYFTREDYENMSASQRDAYLDDLGLLDPPLVQFKNFLVKTFQGDLGESITEYPNTPIGEILAMKIPYSLYFGLAGVFISIILGALLGISMARFKERMVDHIGTIYIVAVRAIPSLIYLFLIQIWVTKLLDLPLVFDEDYMPTWILPTISLALGPIAGYGIWLRRFMVDEENKDYIKYARSKGLSQKTIMYRHVFRNAVVPLLQMLPVQLLLTIAGSLIIERLYSIPGMGGLLVSSIHSQDNNLVQVIVLIYSVLGVIGVFLGDLLMLLVDPRIKLTEKSGE